MGRAELSFVPTYQAYFDHPPGVEHYRLLESLVADLTPGSVVVDVGTLYGSSALAMASNADVTVWTYDITDHIPRDALIRTVPNIIFKLQNGIHAIKDFVDKTSLILLDIDPHDGVQEKEFFEELVRCGYKGRVLCDDIHLNDVMQTWWNSIEQKKRRSHEERSLVGDGDGLFRVRFQKCKSGMQDIDGF